MAYMERLTPAIVSFVQFEVTRHTIGSSNNGADGEIVDSRRWSGIDIPAPVEIVLGWVSSPRGDVS